MANKYSKVLLVLLAIFTFLAAGCGASKNADSSGSAAKSASSSQAANGGLTIQMLNVGQGDSILVKTAEQTVLIDTSDVDERDKLRKELQKAGVKKIDKVILTHPHADHIGGMAVLFDDNYEIGAIYDNGMPSTSRLYLDYVKKAKEKKIEHKGLKEGDVLDFGGGVKFEVLSPTASLVKKGQAKGYKHAPNNESVVGRLVFGQFTMLFTGDAEKETEASILQTHKDDVKSIVLKAPHHGSHTSSSDAYLKAVQPKVCLISCGQGNDYGHPHKETLDKYKRLGAKILETDKNGTITITTDGKTYDVKGEK